MTVLPYASLFLLPLWLIFAPDRGAVTDSLLFLILTLFIGLRRDVGGDWRSYLLLFNRGRSYPLPVAIAVSDPGYMLLGRAVAALNLDVGALNLLCATIFSAGLVLFSFEQAEPALALLIATPVAIVIVAMGFTRQSVALGLVLIATVAASAGNIAAASCCLMAAVLFHSSALLTLPMGLFWAYPQIAESRPAALAGLIAGVALWLAGRLVPAASRLLERYRGSAGAAVRLLPTALCVFIVLLFEPRLEFAGHLAALIPYFTLVSVFLLTTIPYAPTLADRLGFYTVVYQMMVIPAAIQAVTDPAAQAVLLGFVALLYLGLFGAWAFFSKFSASWMPYRSYLAAPRALIARTPTALDMEPPRRERWLPFRGEG